VTVMLEPCLSVKEDTALFVSEALTNLFTGPRSAASPTSKLLIVNMPVAVVLVASAEEGVSFVHVAESNFPTIKLPVVAKASISVPKPAKLNSNFAS